MVHATLGIRPRCEPDRQARQGEEQNEPGKRERRLDDFGPLIPNAFVGFVRFSGVIVGALFPSSGPTGSLAESRNFVGILYLPYPAGRFSMISGREERFALGRLVSLWDMLSFYAQPFSRALELICVLRSDSHKHLAFNEEMASATKRSLSELREQLAALDANVTIMEVDRLSDAIRIDWNKSEAGCSMN
jgi:hypothetical protein